MKLGPQPKKWLEKKAKAGFRGYPVGTIAFYGPDDQRASKVAVGIIPVEGAEAEPLRRWFTESGDARADGATLAEIVAFLRSYAVRSIAMTKGIIGCPHEEGGDYPEGEACPQCPFWDGRDRFGGHELPPTFGHD